MELPSAAKRAAVAVEEEAAVGNEKKAKRDNNSDDGEKDIYKVDAKIKVQNSGAEEAQLVSGEHRAEQQSDDGKRNLEKKVVGGKAKEKAVVENAEEIDDVKDEDEVDDVDDEEQEGDEEEGEEEEEEKEVEEQASQQKQQQQPANNNDDDNANDGSVDDQPNNDSAFPDEDEETITMIDVIEREDKSDGEEFSEERLMSELGKMDRTAAIEAIHGYNTLKEDLSKYLRKFADGKKVVREQDIHEFFDQMRAKKKPRFEE